MSRTILLRSFTTVDLDSLFMPVIVIYKNPSDFPDKYVARLFNVDKPTPIAVARKTLPEIRSIIPRHMIPLPRRATDDPVILETWI